jgi:FtsZ-interacting cell division protein YlmF
MNFIKKLLKDDDDELYDEKYKDDYVDEKANGKIADNSGAGEIIDDIPPAETAEQTARPAVGVKGNGAAVSLRVIKPKSYDDGPEIADFIAGGCTVVMNIEDLSRENARRLIDFLLGAVHVLGGDLQMASQNTFVVAPCSVGVGKDNDSDSGSGIDNGSSEKNTAGGLFSSTGSIGDFIQGDKAKTGGDRSADVFGFNK